MTLNFSSMMIMFKVVSRDSSRWFSELMYIHHSRENRITRCLVFLQLLYSYCFVSNNNHLTHTQLVFDLLYIYIVSILLIIIINRIILTQVVSHLFNLLLLMSIELISRSFAVPLIFSNRQSMTWGHHLFLIDKFWFFFLIK